MRLLDGKPLQSPFPSLSSKPLILFLIQKMTSIWINQDEVHLPLAVWLISYFKLLCPTILSQHHAIFAETSVSFKLRFRFLVIDQVIKGLIRPHRHEIQGE
jgi:hypothetical protein